MKKAISILAAAMMLSCTFVSCGSSGSTGSSVSESAELSGKYDCCNGLGVSYEGIFSFEFNGDKFVMKGPGPSGQLVKYISGTFETADGKITLHLNETSKEDVKAFAGTFAGSMADYITDSDVEEYNKGAKEKFEGTYDYKVFDGKMINITAVDSFASEILEHVKKEKQNKANSACRYIRFAVESSYSDAEIYDKLPARTRKSKPIIYSSDAAKTLNCDGLNDVFHDMIVNYYEDADQYDYIVVIDKDGFVELAACCKKGDKYVGLYPASGDYNGTDVSGMTLDEIYELVSK